MERTVCITGGRYRGLRHILKMFYLQKIKKLSLHEIRIMHLKRIGMDIGKNCWIFSDKLETAEPYLVSIGDHVTISSDVIFLTHDTSASYYLSGASDIFGKINVGNRCFIGAGSILLPGVTLAEDVIVGAGSVVTKSFMTKGVVIAGNPAKIICYANELKEKNKDRILNTWNMDFEKKKKYLLDNEDKFKEYYLNTKGKNVK